MSGTPTVSIIVPVYNGKAVIAACLHSLLTLDFPVERRELIVVDNASSDGTAEVFAEFGSAIRVLFEPKRGPAAARNTGIRQAHGGWIALTDADCVVDPAWLGQLIAPLEDPGVGIVGGRILALRPCNRVQRFGEKVHDHQRAIEDVQLRDHHELGVAPHRAGRLGRFNEVLLRGSDSECAARVAAAGYRLVYQREAVIYHRNEATLRGLFADARDHGRGAAMTNAAAGQRSVVALLRPRTTLRALGGNTLRSLTGPERFEALSTMVFELGKATGKLNEYRQTQARAPAVLTPSTWALRFLERSRILPS